VFDRLCFRSFGELGALARNLFLAVLVGHRAEESHCKDAKDAKETARGTNRSQ
jgi:hypothetical protein